MFGVGQGGQARSLRLLDVVVGGQMDGRMNVQSEIPLVVAESSSNYFIFVYRRGNRCE